MKKLTTEEFITRSIIIHQNKYNYNKSVYTTSGNKLEIICPIHGTFYQTPADHLYGGYGCPRCKFDKLSLNRTIKAKNNFKDKAAIIHQEKYDYSEVVYVTSKSQIVVICKDHGPFLITPNKHLSGGGCKLCGYLSVGEAQAKSPESFVTEANTIHNNKYEYITKYTRWNSPIEINCPLHGKFTMKASDHLRGCGCPQCDPSYQSRPVTLICDILTANNITYEQKNL